MIKSHISVPNFLFASFIVQSCRSNGEIFVNPELRRNNTDQQAEIREHLNQNKETWNFFGSCLNFFIDKNIFNNFFLAMKEKQGSVQT